MGHIYYFRTALTELSSCSAAKDQDTAPSPFRFRTPGPWHSGHLKDLTYAPPGGPAVFEHFNLEVTPGERSASLRRPQDQNRAGTSAVRLRLTHRRFISITARPATSQPRLRQSVQGSFDSQLSLFEGRSRKPARRDYIPYSDVSWALRFTDLKRFRWLGPGRKRYPKHREIFAPTTSYASWSRVPFWSAALLIFEVFFTIFRRRCVRRFLGASAARGTLVRDLCFQ